ncbi:MULTISPECIES: RNA-binding domain-containing protein [unclassified Leucobacter]|uniref:RNA-binding domain-containing protein n=1 Tax=unclassified Leucobacter TaxID=2621730 RepID=UPI0013042B62|nr:MULTISPECIES: RNA-binding domain-containing protein [unclassified Leucobacter]
MVHDLRQRGSDHTEVEAKRAAGGTPELGETLAAFANMPGGGTILLGLDEAAGFRAVGVEDPAQIIKAVASQARNAIKPQVQVSFEEETFEGVQIIVVSVAPLPLHDRPARYKGQPYLRLADGDYVMSEQEIQQVYAMRTKPRHDADPVAGSSLTDLDPALVEAFVQQARQAKPQFQGVDANTILTRKAVLDASGQHATVAGLYAMGVYPQQFLPSLAITAAVQHNLAGERGLSALTDITGPIPEMLDQAMDWVRRNTKTRIRFEASGSAFDEDELPMIAVRELIANALVHRDLSQHAQGKRVELRLKDDTLIIASPGGLFGVSTGQLGHPQGKSAVNEFLYDICKLVRRTDGARIIEGEGGGIRDAQRALRQANMRPPKFIDRGVNFTVLLPRHALLEQEDLSWLDVVDPAHRLSEIQRQVAASMRHGDVWSNSLVRKRFAPIDSVEARFALQGLVTLGLAERRGERAQTEYVIDEKHALPGVIVDPYVDSLLSGERLRELEHEAVEILNFDPIQEALDGGVRLSLRELVDATGLSEGQTRYALNRAVKAGYIEREGGQGVRNTRYRLPSA